MIKRGVNIYIDETEAQKAVENLQLKFEKLKNEMQALENQGKKGSKEWKNLSNNLNKVENDLKEVSQEIQFTEMTMKQLESVKARLNAQLKSAIPGTEEWKQYANGIQVCEKRLQELKAGAKNTDGAIRQLDNSVSKSKSGIQKLADGFNRFQALALGAAAAIAGITITIKNCIQSYAELTDAIADVRKTTGLTIEETKELDKSLKSYDTRTSRLQLLQLARDAGKLGVEGKQNIIDFVKEADKIQIALGEDLGEEGITNIAKIANVFGLVKNMGIGAAMDAIGSSINNLGQASTANESYIVEFTHRLGGVGAQARISVQNIMGYASALDQAGLNVEMSATALQQFIMKMMADPAKFAKTAGLEVKAFTELVATDANAALMQMLGAMKAKGGFQSMIPMFADMGTEGVRAVGVLASLANKLDLVTEAQELSNTSFAESNSISKEAAIRQETAGAKLDTAKKKLAEVSVELGEKLYPLMTQSLSLTSYIIKALNVLVSNLGDIIKTVGICVVAWGVYMITMETALVKTRLLTIETTALTVAQRILNTVAKMNPWGLLATAVLTATAAMGIYNSTINNTIEAESEESKAKREEIEKLKDLKAQLNKANISKTELKRITDEINKIAPGMLSNLDAEAFKTGNVSKQLEKYIRLKTYKKALDDEDDLLKSFKNEKKELENSDQTSWIERNILYNDAKIRKLNKERKAKRLAELDQEIKDSEKRRGIFVSETEKIEIDINKNTKTKTTNVGESEKEKKAKEKLEEEKKEYEKELKEAEEAGKAKQLLTEKDYTKGLISQETYNKKTIENEIDALKAKMAVEIKNKKSTLDTELEIEKKERDLQELKYKDELDILQAGETEYKNELEKQLADHEITQEQYNQLMLAKEIAIIQKKLELQKEFGINSIKTEKELAEAKVKLEKEIQNQQKKESKSTPKKGSTKYKTEFEKLRDEQTRIEGLYKEGKMSYQEYNDALEDIAKKRINNITEETKQGLQDASTAVSSLKDADLTKAETTYNKELNALKQKLDKGIISQEEYNEKSTALEEKKEQEQKEIKKKYAGIELAINISKIISETALAVMKSIATLGIPLGIPFGVLAGAAGAAQIAAAVAEYNNIQGLESGLYPTVTRSQDGKQFKVDSVNKMQTGVFSKPSVLVGEAGPELVVDNKRFKKIMRDRPEVINYIVNGYEKGKYPSLSKKAIDNASSNNDAVMYAVVTMLDKLNQTINDSDIYTLRKGLKKADKVVDKINNKFK